MRAHYFQHVPFEGLGAIESWLRVRGWEIGCTRFYAGELPPSPDAIDFLIVMGGPMSVNDEARHPWLVEEKRFIAEALRAGRPVLGVCLGAQLMASVLGARVTPQRDREIGWLPLEGVAARDAFPFPEATTVFHWHGETFDLPEGGKLLARSEACAHQAFQWGQRAVGLQFHMETTPVTAYALCEHCADELTPGPYVQSAEVILTTDEHYAPNHHLLGALLAYLTR